MDWEMIISNCILCCCCFLLCFSQCLSSAFCLFTLFSVVNFRSLRDSARIFFPRKKKENLPIRLVSRKGLRNDENLGIFWPKSTSHIVHMWSWSRIFIHVGMIIWSMQTKLLIYAISRWSYHFYLPFFSFTMTRKP